MRFSANEYYALANADCISVAKALGMQVDEGKQTTTKAVHIKHSGGLYIFPEKNKKYITWINGSYICSAYCNQKESINNIIVNERNIKKYFLSI